MKTTEELLKELRMGPEGPDSRNDRNNKLHGLYDLIKDYVNQDAIMVEIGSYRGASTELFAKHCKKIHAIDPWSKVVEGKYVNVTRATRKMPAQMEAEEVFLKRMSAYNNVEIIKDFSYNVYDRFEDQSLDMIYIDGHHTFDAALEDVRQWLPKLKTGGVLAGHDYSLPEIKKLVDMITESIPERKRYRDTSWAFVKPNTQIESKI